MYGDPPGSPDPACASLPEGADAWVRAHWDHTPVGCEPMQAGAGARRYWRLSDRERRSIVFMWALPEDPAILPPALRAPHPGIPFLDVAEFLAAAGIPVPRVHAFDLTRRFVLIEDLGRRHLGDLEGLALRQGYGDAIDVLARTHALAAPSGASEPPLPYRRCFDAEWVRFELRLFAGLDWSEATRARLVEPLEALVQRVAALPRVLCLRDYQSQNLLLDPSGRLRVIDFQDALLAPAALDLAALLWDSYLSLPEPERAALLRRYDERAPRAVPREELALLIVQRKCKDLSRFHTLVHVRGDRRYTHARERAGLAIREAARELPAPLGGLRQALERALPELGV